MTVSRGAKRDGRSPENLEQLFGSTWRTEPKPGTVRFRSQGDVAMSAARSRRNRDATHVVGGARWLVADLIRFDHRSIRRPRPMLEALIEMEHAGCLGGRQAETGIGAWPLDVRPLLLDSTPDAVPCHRSPLVTE